MKKTVMLIPDGTGKMLMLEGTNEAVAKKLTKILVRALIDVLRERDIQRGLIDENFEPFNRHLSAEENKQCWEHLALQFVKCILKVFLPQNLMPSGDILFRNWLSFLQDVNNFIKCGSKDELIERIINSSGIPETTWVKFLD